jgi:hypothetical protein
MLRDSTMPLNDAKPAFSPQALWRLGDALALSTLVGSGEGNHA